MIELYTWPTPNGRKISILLEEMEIPYKVIPIDISVGEQFFEKNIFILILINSL